MLNHLEACPYCPKYGNEGCTIYANVAWVNRRGGCDMIPDRGESPLKVKKRAGQQKQKHSDRSYASKNDGKRKFTRVDS